MSKHSEERAAQDRRAREYKDSIDAAMKRAVSALDGVDSGAKEQLAGARNLFRKSEPIHSEVVERVETVLPTDFGNWLLYGGEPPYAAINDDAMIVADMLSNIGETESQLEPERVRAWGMYLHRMLGVSDSMFSYWVDKTLPHTGGAVRDDD